MRVAVITGGVVSGVYEIDNAMVIDADRRAARGPAQYTVETRGDVTTVDYQAVFTPTPDGSLLVASFDATLGWTWTEETGFTQVDLNSTVAPVPVSISDRQFFQQLAVVGTITQAEALAAVKTGTLPAAIEAIVNALPADARFAAEMLLSGATVFERSHPLSAAIGAAQGLSVDQIDDFFRAAHAL